MPGDPPVPCQAPRCPQELSPDSSHLGLCPISSLLPAARPTCTPNPMPARKEALDHVPGKPRDFCVPLLFPSSSASAPLKDGTTEGWGQIGRGPDRWGFREQQEWGWEPYLQCRRHHCVSARNRENRRGSPICSLLRDHSVLVSPHL